METQRQQAAGNAQLIPNQNNPGNVPYTLNCAAQFIIFAWMSIYFIASGAEIMCFIASSAEIMCFIASSAEIMCFIALNHPPPSSA